MIFFILKKIQKIMSKIEVTWTYLKSQEFCKRTFKTLGVNPILRHGFNVTKVIAEVFDSNN